MKAILAVLAEFGKMQKTAQKWAKTAQKWAKTAFFGRNLLIISGLSHLR